MSKADRPITTGCQGPAAALAAAFPALGSKDMLSPTQIAREAIPDRAECGEDEDAVAAFNDRVAAGIARLAQVRSRNLRDLVVKLELVLTRMDAYGGWEGLTAEECALLRSVLRDARRMACAPRRAVGTARRST